MDNEGSEADWMYAVDLTQSGAEMEVEDPEFEVVNTKNKRLFYGTRSECWGFKRSVGGYVRPFSGFDEHHY